MTARLALRPRTSPLPGLALLAAAGAIFWGGEARADGAFPNTLSILTPEQLPNETLLATNFGLVMSFDHEQTWIWSCEQALNSFATLYQMGPPPLNRIYAVSPTSLIRSDDSSCNWTASANGAVDAFVDPTNQNRVLAVVAASADAGSIYTVVESADAGATFPQLRYTAAAGDHITGVEIARSDPQTVYLTLTSGAAYTPKIAASSNGGASWTLHDLSASLATGTYSIRLVAVDPTNPGKLILRVGSGAGEALAISTDGGVSATTPLTFAGGVFTAFARMSSGSLIAGGVVGISNVGYRSVDGATFQQLPAVPFTFKAMSARGTTLYAALDNMSDPFAIETSADEGMTWRPLMRFNKDVDGGATGYIQAIQTCVMSYCQTDCDTRASAELFSQDICSAAVMPAPIDGGGGAPGTGTGGATGRGGTNGAGGGSGGKTTSDGGHPDAQGGTTPGSGCGHCALGPEPAASSLSLSALMAGVLFLGLRRGRR